MTTEERIEKMERDYRRLKIGVYCVAAFALLVAFTSGISLDPLTTRGLVIEDDDGNTRAVLGTKEDMVTFDLLDKNGKPRASMAVMEHGPLVMLNDKNGKVRASMVVAEDDPAVTLRDGNGKTRTLMTLIEGNPAFNLLDEKGDKVFGHPAGAPARSNPWLYNN
jgi:hypothetical protein